MDNKVLHENGLLFNKRNKKLRLSETVYEKEIAANIILRGIKFKKIPSNFHKNNEIMDESTILHEGKSINFFCSFEQLKKIRYIITEKPPLIPVSPPPYSAYNFSLDRCEGLCELFDIPRK